MHKLLVFGFFDNFLPAEELGLGIGGGSSGGGVN